MIIDLILDRKDNISEGFTDDYNAHDFYMECMGYNSIFYGIADGYILKNGYNTEICEFIQSVNWL